MENKQKRKTSGTLLGAVIMIAGFILLTIGLIVKIPTGKLSYYAYNDEYTEVHEYVGGDAYNYIIASNIASAEIISANIKKTIYVSSGIMTVLFGIVVIYYFEKKEENKHLIDNNE